MEEFIIFEKTLFDDQNVTRINIIDVDFWVDRIVIFPSLRPLFLHKVVNLCEEYAKNTDFRKLLLEKAIRECPVLVYQLFKLDIYSFEEIRGFLDGRDSFISCFYFRKEINDFNKYIKGKRTPVEYDLSIFHNEEEVSLMIENGFVPTSIEYCLKYDDLETFVGIFPVSQKSAKWNPFEWSAKPVDLSLISFSSFFGSLNCFKHMLMNGYSLNDVIQSIVVCSGNIDMFHLFNPGEQVSPEQLCYASEFCHHFFICYFLENKSPIDQKNKYWSNPLHYASRNGHLSVVDYLVKQGADINSKGDEIGLMFFHGPLFMKLRIIRI